jgi:hypothetical protein
MTRFTIATIVVPSALFDDANAAMLVLGNGPADAGTFISQEWALSEDAETGFALVSGLYAQDFLDALQGPSLTVRPGFAPDVNMTGANRAKDALIYSGAARLDKISIRLDMPAHEAITEMGLMPWADPDAPVPAVVDYDLLEWRETAQASRLQGRLVLGPQTCALLDAMAADPDTPWAMRETILNASVWYRNSPTMDELSWLLGYSPEQSDALFRQAEGLRV